MQLALQVEVVQVKGMDGFGRASLMEPARAGKHGLDHVFAQDQQAGQSAKRDVETLLTGLVVSLFVLIFGNAAWRDAAAHARVTSLALLFALRSVAEIPDLTGYAFLASPPLGSVAALEWCAGNWRGWVLT